MSIPVVCPFCNAKMMAKDAFAGRRVNCQKCGVPITIVARCVPVKSEAKTHSVVFACSCFFVLSFGLAVLGIWHGVSKRNDRLPAAGLPQEQTVKQEAGSTLSAAELAELERLRARENTALLNQESERQHKEQESERQRKSEANRIENEYQEYRKFRSHINEFYIEENEAMEEWHKVLKKFWAADLEIMELNNEEKPSKNKLAAAERTFKLSLIEWDAPVGKLELLEEKISAIVLASKAYTSVLVSFRERVKSRRLVWVASKKEEQTRNSVEEKALAKIVSIKLGKEFDAAIANFSLKLADSIRRDWESETQTKTLARAVEDAKMIKNAANADYKRYNKWKSSHEATKKYISYFKAARKEDVGGTRLGTRSLSISIAMNKLTQINAHFIGKELTKVRVKSIVQSLTLEQAEDMAYICQIAGSMIPKYVDDEQKSTPEITISESFDAFRALIE